MLTRDQLRLPCWCSCLVMWWPLSGLGENMAACEEQRVSTTQQVNFPMESARFDMRKAAKGVAELRGGAMGG